jgi:hypothetical protein
MASLKPVMIEVLSFLVKQWMLEQETTLPFFLDVLVDARTGNIARKGFVPCKERLITEKLHYA